MLTSFDSGEDRQFKGAVSAIVNKAQLDVDQLEQSIYSRMQREN
jgi:hypothetical protein